MTDLAKPSDDSGRYVRHGSLVCDLDDPELNIRDDATGVDFAFADFHDEDTHPDWHALDRADLTQEVERRMRVIFLSMLKGIEDKERRGQC